MDLKLMLIENVNGRTLDDGNFARAFGLCELKYEYIDFSVFRVFRAHFSVIIYL